MRHRTWALFAAGILSIPSVLASQATPPPISESKLVERITAYMDSVSALDRFSGVVLLAKAGKPFCEDCYAYVRRHIYEPAGMTRSGHYAVDSLPPNTATGWTRGDEDAPPSAPLRSNAAELPGRGSAAGGGYSTAHDLMRFVQALRERRIVAGAPPGLGIAGGSGGVNAVVEGDLPGGYDLFVLANMDPPAAELVAQAVRGWLGVKDQ